MHNAMQPVGASDRSKVRMERLRRIELEQQQWEQEALVMPEAWDQLLLATFESVKTEFSDLDGLSWSQYRGPLGVDPRAYDEALPARSECDQSSAVPGCSRRPDRSSQPYTAPSRSELASFGPGGTIRAPQRSTSHSSLCSTNQCHECSRTPLSRNVPQSHDNRHNVASAHS
ncbi:hypothetical protein EDC04DRAFT_660601 [Pisolithus marmoratus]|nr:hypothetical protein EDC04DRAFT_660601 [Pisolithus marmoratus]